MRRALIWLGGLWAGVAIGAAVACPVREISVPISIALAILFTVIGVRRGREM